MVRWSAAAAAIAVLWSAVAMAQEPSRPSVAYGQVMSIIGGCHDCHTSNYSEKGGVIDPATALAGSPVGFRGPWGTTYAINLRLLVSEMSEDDWVSFLKNFTALPPMPYYNVRHMDEVQMRSLYEYIASLGALGETAPEDVRPGQEPKTPFLVFAPPTVPAP
ncbi:hypothetical protein PH547_26515 [Rhizobium sp. CNPSo 3464]|uniref:hypothetical protein n=1 Tax=Rhizobium sp. CNPSo 3464 TaxID=3021406 RepID=UPI00254A5638|nr:hypothetical protein [Rhizobium sp. CNPSo 3464]MDK4742450.1 hypothetical protein [Rhizobium sp. CNPSo 3464]